MAYILLSENMQGSCFAFLENDDDKREGLFITQPLGKVVKGTLALQIFDDRNYKRITFADAKNVYTALTKDLVDYVVGGMAKNILSFLSTSSKLLSRNELCKFDFSPEEIKNGRKLMRFECMLSTLGSICLMCYDFDTYEGCSYLFPNYNTAKEWSDILKIDHLYLYDIDDKFASIVSFEE